MEGTLPGHTPDMRQAPSLAVSVVPANTSPLSSRADGSQAAARSLAESQRAQTFAEAYEAHFDFVWRSARRLGVPEASTDDVVQDVFVTVYRRLGEFEGRSQLRTWIFGILRHTVRDLRRSQRRKPTEPFTHEPETLADGPHDTAAEREGTRLLHEVLLSLDDDQREVFVLAELEQMSAPEIGVALEVNVNTVYSRLRAARQSFEAALKRLRSRDEWRIR